MKIPVLYMRVSTRDQALNGGGLEDQERAGLAYIQSMPGLDAGRLTILRDEGISSYKGGNLQEGMPLREFVQGCVDRRDGNQYALIVYSVDRISRMNVWESSQFVGQAIMSGIEIHDLMTRQVLRSDDQIGAILSTLNLMRANSESDAKSKRKLASIEANIKRSIETGKAYKAKCPKWLRIENEQYVIVDEIADCLRDAVDWYITGWTSGQIVKELNSTNRTYGGVAWSAAFLVKTLKSETLIGTWTRTLDGEKIQYENFYPAIVEKEKHELMLRIINNIGKKFLPKHRVDKGRVVNILAGMIYCVCGGVIHINRARQDQKYFYCSNNYGRRTCTEPKGNFLSLERAILTHLKGIDLNAILNQPDDHLRKSVESELIEARGVLIGIEGNIHKRKESGKLVLPEMLEALGDTRDMVKVLEDRLKYEFSTSTVPDMDFDVEEIIKDTHPERGKLHREIGTVLDKVKVIRHTTTVYAILIYKNGDKHTLLLNNKTGEVLHSVLIHDDNDTIEIFGGYEDFLKLAEDTGTTLPDGYRVLTRKTE